MASHLATKLERYSDNYVLFSKIFERMRHSKASKLEMHQEDCGRNRPQKKSFWKILSGRKKDKSTTHGPVNEENNTPEVPCEEIFEARKQPDPHFDNLEGTIYRTEMPGHYILQKDLTEENLDVKPSPEEKLLQKLERHPSVKDVEDPMPPFVNVGQRMLDLTERKLHPNYKNVEMWMRTASHPQKIHQFMGKDDLDPFVRSVSYSNGKAGWGIRFIENLSISGSGRYIFAPKKPEKQPSHKFVKRGRKKTINDEVAECKAKIMEKKNLIREIKKVEPPGTDI